MKAWKEPLRSAVCACFERAVKRNPKVSLRAFASQIDVPKSTISEIMKGTFSLSEKRAVEIVQRLSLKPAEKNRLLLALGQTRNVEWNPLKGGDYNILTDWAYLAILHFFDIEGDKRPPAIAKRLGLDLKKTEDVIHDLISRELLAIDGSGAIVSTGKSWQTTDGPPSKIIRKHHTENLKLAQRALNRLPLEERDFTSYTFAGNSDQVGFIREEIRKLHQRIGSFAESVSPKHRLFRISVSFFSLDLPPERI